MLRRTTEHRQQALLHPKASRVIGSTSAYTERLPEEPGALLRFSKRVSAPLSRRLVARALAHADIAGKVHSVGAAFRKLSKLDRAEAMNALRERLRSGGLRPDDICESFAITSEICFEELGMRHYDEQLLGGWVLTQGAVAEMLTGEGKTLTALLAASAFGMAKIPVHVITTNDYLAERDFTNLKSVYEKLGVTVGLIQSGMPFEERRSAYMQDVVYVSNKEVAFDYLRDRTRSAQAANPVCHSLRRGVFGEGANTDLTLRGLFFAIVDEADSILIDDARTPLILSGNVPSESGVPSSILQDALDCAKELVEETDFRMDPTTKRPILTARGTARLRSLVEEFGQLSDLHALHSSLITTAVSALHGFQHNQHYLISDGKLVLVDEETGRAMQDRSWTNGLQQLVELKEHLELSPETEPLQQTTVVSFFERYLGLAGMTGTAREVAPALWENFGLPTVVIPPHRPVYRKEVKPDVLLSRKQRGEAIRQLTLDLAKERRPVLIGTGSIAESLEIAALLDEVEIRYELLDASQDSSEASKIAVAGQRDAVTVATQIAGRGTDIKLGKGVAELGGLYVIAAGIHHSPRVDRQLAGRCARQGDPGTYHLFVSLEDDIPRQYGNQTFERVCRLIWKHRPSWKDFASMLHVRLAQRTAVRTHARVNAELIRADELRNRSLAFSGSVR